jgi:hypothetical protein
VSHEVVCYGVGISIVFFFFRYAVSAMPKSIAWAGVIAGMIIALADNLMPGIKLSVPSIGLLVIGAVCIGGAIHLAWAQSSPVQNPPIAGGGGIPPGIGNDNTIVNAPVPPKMGSGNTIVGPTDSRGNMIINQGGTAIGAGACADGTSVAIGAGAGAGACAKPK